VAVPAGAGSTGEPIAAAIAAQRDVILSAAEVQPLLGQPGIKLIDTRPRKDFAKGHLPDAISLPWQELNVSERDGMRNELATDEELARRFGAAGLSYDDTIILCDATTLAGRGYVAFEYAGFTRIHVLDGGFGQWTGPVSTETTAPQPAAFVLARTHENRVDKAYVASKLGDPGAIIVDSRPQQAYEDGHIPTAAVVPTDLYLDQTKFRLPKGELLATLAAKGLTPDREVVSYCGSGVAAANAYLVLKDLGFKNVVLYDGSWDEWSCDPAAGQEVTLPNYTFPGAASGAGSSLGPAFLSQEEVKALQVKPGVVIVDVRSPADFNAGRIPSSVNVYWNETLDGNRVLKGRDELVACYAAQGVTPDKRVVLFTRGGLQLAHSFTVLKLLGYPQVDAFTGKWEGWDNASYRSL
jgi:thiosulfate/3-mercaptopyruvate sulfurtransferase